MWSYGKYTVTSSIWNFISLSGSLSLGCDGEWNWKRSYVFKMKGYPDDVVSVSLTSSGIRGGQVVSPWTGFINGLITHASPEVSCYYYKTFLRS